MNMVGKKNNTCNVVLVVKNPINYGLTIKKKQPKTTRVIHYSKTSNNKHKELYEHDTTL